MTSDKKSNNNLNNDVFIADIMLRLSALEKILIDKGIINQSELTAMTKDIAEKVARTVVDKLNNSKDMESFVGELNKEPKKDFNN